MRYNRGMQIPDFHVGEVYTNHDIVDAFKCGNMGGMRRSKLTNSLVLIAKYDGCYREHDWDEGKQILNYMGMGKTGDQSLDYAQNKTLAKSRENGVNVYLFENPANGEYLYCGEVELATDPFEVVIADANGKQRKVIKFPLRAKPAKEDITIAPTTT